MPRLPIQEQPIYLQVVRLLHKGEKTPKAILDSFERSGTRNERKREFSTQSISQKLRHLRTEGFVSPEYFGTYALNWDGWTEQIAEELLGALEGITDTEHTRTDIEEALRADVQALGTAALNLKFGSTLQEALTFIIAALYFKNQEENKKSPLSDILTLWIMRKAGLEGAIRAATSLREEQPDAQEARKLYKKHPKKIAAIEKMKINELRRKGKTKQEAEEQLRREKTALGLR